MGSDCAHDAWRLLWRHAPHDICKATAVHAVGHIQFKVWEWNGSCMPCCGWARSYRAKGTVLDSQCRLEAHAQDACLPVHRLQGWEKAFEGKTSVNQPLSMMHVPQHFEYAIYAFFCFSAMLGRGEAGPSSGQDHNVCPNEGMECEACTAWVCAADAHNRSRWLRVDASSQTSAHQPAHQRINLCCGVSSAVWCPKEMDRQHSARFRTLICLALRCNSMSSALGQEYTPPSHSGVLSRMGNACSGPHPLRESTRTSPP
jgi:hypothetical protein